MNFTLTEHDGIARTRFPITGGIPFSKAAIWDSARLILRDGQDVELPLQVEPTAHWPDGSVKWALLDFQADLPALSTRPFTLETDGLRVPLSFLEPQGLVNGEPFPLIAESMVGSQVRLTDTQGRTWHNEAGATTVERSGSLHSTVCTRGLVRSPDGDRCVHWEAYTDFYRDTRWVHTRFVYGADARHVSFIPRPKDVAPPLEFSDLSIVLELAPGQGAVKTCCSRSLWTGGYRGPFEADHALTQVQLDEQEWRIMNGQGCVLETGSDKAEGYAGSRREGRDGIAIGLAELWQSHPKALRASADTVELALWPRECGKPLKILPGACRAHSLYLTPYQDAKDLRSFVLGMASPILPRMAIEDINRTGVMPPMLSPINTPAPMLERLIEGMFPGFTPYSNSENMGVWGTGEWNWGDYSAPLYDKRKIAIGKGEGGTWANGEAQGGYGLLLQYLRTGRIDCLTMGLACARHKAGVDTVNHAQEWQIGAQHIHCLNHATGQCVPCHTWTSELALGWLLTGDLWLRSVLKKTADHLVLMNREADLAGFRERAGGWILIALCACFEGLGDERCLHLARRAVEGLKRWIETDDGAIAIPPARKAHSPAHTCIAMTGIADYGWLTDDPLARDALLAGGKLLLEKGRDSNGFFTTADAPGYRIYSQAPRWPLAQCLPVMDALYRLTGDRAWLEVGLRQCRLLFKLTQAETGWKEEQSWPHEGSLIYAYAFGFLESAREAGLLTDLE